MLKNIFYAILITFICYLVWPKQTIYAISRLADKSFRMGREALR